MTENIDNENAPRDYAKEVEDRVKKEAAALAAEQAKKKFAGVDQRGSDGKITSKFIQECLYANELGDGMLYAALHKDEFLYNKSSGSWMVWAKHFWQDDLMTTSQSVVESVALEYQKEAQKIVEEIGAASTAGDKEKVATLQKTQATIYRRICRLRSDRGRLSTLKFAHTNPVNPLSVKGDEFDINPYLFACKNGVIDLRTGEIRPGQQSDFISKCSSVEYPGVTAPAPEWGKALSEIFDEDERLVEYVNRVFGYCLTGLNVDSILPIFYGQGRNGKSMIIEIISHIMGGLAAPIQSEMLLDQGRAKNSASASPDIMALRGLRLAFACETDQGRRFSTAKVKWLTGTDSMTGRYLYDKRDITFKPTHKLIMMTNHKPDVSDDDFAFWERVHLVPFALSFVNRKPEKDNERLADKYLREKLLQEAPGILAWLVRGCISWQQIGLAPPPAVVDATKEYRANEDLLGHFIAECCFENTTAETPAKDLYDSFKKWWEENVSRKVLSQKRFGGMMVKKYKRSKSGTYRYFGIGVNDDDY